MGLLSKRGDVQQEGSQEPIGWPGWKTEAVVYLTSLWCSRSKQLMSDRSEFILLMTLEILSPKINDRSVSWPFHHTGQSHKNWMLKEQRTVGGKFPVAP